MNNNTNNITNTNSITNKIVVKNNDNDNSSNNNNSNSNSNNNNLIKWCEMVERLLVDYMTKRKDSINSKTQSMTSKRIRE